MQDDSKMNPEVLTLFRDAVRAKPSFVALQGLARRITDHNFSLMRKRSETALAINNFSEVLNHLPFAEHTIRERCGSEASARITVYYLKALMDYQHTAAKYRQAFVMYAPAEDRAAFEEHWKKVGPILESIRAHADQLKAEKFTVTPLYQKKTARHESALDRLGDKVEEMVQNYHNVRRTPEGSV